jgi:hypothetical protein
MEQPILKDKNEFPTQEIIFSHIGETKTLWEAVFDYVHTNHADFSEEWRYYNDGKNWLLKVQKKSRTIFWTSVYKGSFKMTFYFTNKAEQAIMDSAISDELKKQFKSGKKYGKIRGLTITFKDEKDVDYAKSLIAIKLAIK